MTSTIANPLFDPLQGDLLDTPTASVIRPALSEADAAASSHTPQQRTQFIRSALAQAKANDEARVSDDLFGQQQVSRVFGAQKSRASLFDDDDDENDEQQREVAGNSAFSTFSTETASGKGNRSGSSRTGAGTVRRRSRYAGLLGDEDEEGNSFLSSKSQGGRSLSQTGHSSRAPTPLPSDRRQDDDNAEPSLNLLTTLHRMQDADIDRYMRIFGGPSNRSTSSSTANSRSGPKDATVRERRRPEASPSISSIGTFDAPDVSTPSEDHSLLSPPSTTASHEQSGASTSSLQPPELKRNSSSKSTGSQEEGSGSIASYELVRHLSSALSAAVQSASDANADVDLLREEYERAMDHKRREWEARETALRALCSLHGIKNGEIDRALMRASPLQQELETKKVAGVVPHTPGAPSSSSASDAPTPVKSQENLPDPESDAITAGGLSALHESLQEAMLDDLERSPSTITASPMPAFGQSRLDAGDGAGPEMSEGSVSPNVPQRHRRSSSRSTVATTRTRDTSPGAVSARSSRSQRPTSVSSAPTSEGTSVSKSASAPPSSSVAIKSTSAAASAAATFSRAFWRTKKSPSNSSSSLLNAKPADKPAQPSVTRLPTTFSFGSAKASSASSATQRGSNSNPHMSRETESSGIEKAPNAAVSGPKTVELDFILPSDAKPPTFASLSRRATTSQTKPAGSSRRKRRNAAHQRSRDENDSEESSGDEFEVYGGKGSLVPPRPVFSEVGSDLLAPQLLTDRYGFVYDATPADIKLLREARRASSSAPACLTGIRVGMKARGIDDSDEEGGAGGSERTGEEGIGAGDETDQDNSVDADSELAEPLSGDEEASGSRSSDTEGSRDEDVSREDATMIVGGNSSFSVKTSAAPAMLTLDLPPSLDFTGLDKFDTATTASSNGTNASKIFKAGLTPVSESKPVIEASVILAESQEVGRRLGPTSPSQELEFRMSGNRPTTSALNPIDSERGGEIPGDLAMAQTPSSRKTSDSRKQSSAAPTGSQTVRRLLGQLKAMHDEQQSKQQAEWDQFLQRRKDRQLAAIAAATAQANQKGNRISRVFGAPAASPAPEHASLVSEGNSLISAARSNLPGSAAEEEQLILSLVGIQRFGSGLEHSHQAQTQQQLQQPQNILSRAGKEDWAELQRLCRAGIPLCYRGAIWKECSGATEIAEPGRYEELLGEHEGETNDCLTQIDLDVHRTMPTNIFFGGNGPGVPKLRRVLVAFSWYDPVCGYCQGMNNLAATLLLTLPNEEDAFWTLVCIIGKVLPPEYYTSHLLVSQADQRVLVELVEEHMPKLAGHMREIGVDLPAVTFAWFLSLYTDCLPVETLFRVWDILFIDGMVVLFRIAMAILLLSEKELLATSGPAAFYGHMHSLTSRMFSVDRLFKLACGELATTIRYPQILTRREKHVKDLRVELGLDTA
ncbi:hypothetical protein OC845_003065 [Tilletia horrida]|nr:hypothetical protein OC845_003065 [Tilletia horrida]